MTIVMRSNTINMPTIDQNTTILSKHTFSSASSGFDWLGGNLCLSISFQAEDLVLFGMDAQLKIISSKFQKLWVFNVNNTHLYFYHLPKISLPILILHLAWTSSNNSKVEHLFKLIRDQSGWEVVDKVFVTVVKALKWRQPV